MVAPLLFLEQLSFVYHMSNTKMVVKVLMIKVIGAIFFTTIFTTNKAKTTRSWHMSK